MKHAKSARANTQYAYQEYEKQSMNNLVARESNSTKQKKGRHAYRDCIYPCGKCSRKFYVPKTVVEVYLRKDIPILCGPCSGKSEADRYVSDIQNIKIKRGYEAMGCTVRMATPEERIRFNLSPL